MKAKYQALLVWAIALLLTAFAWHSATAQVQFSGGGSLLKGSGYYDNHAYLVGGNVSMKYVIKDFILVGVQGRMYQANTTAYPDYNASDKAQNLIGVVEVVFNRRKKLKPYLGLNAGISSTSHMINYVRYGERKTIYGMNGGFLYNLGQSTGLFTSLGYNYTPGSGEQRHIEGVNNPVLTEGINRFVSLDVGLFIRLYTKQ